MHTKMYFSINQQRNVCLLPMFKVANGRIGGEIRQILVLDRMVLEEEEVHFPKIEDNFLQKMSSSKYRSFFLSSTLMTSPYGNTYWLH